MPAAADFVADFGTFAATEITVSAVTHAGKALLAETFGAAAVSVTLPKSQGPAFAAFVESRGLNII